MFGVKRTIVTLYLELNCVNGILANVANVAKFRYGIRETKKVLGFFCFIISMISTVKPLNTADLGTGEKAAVF